METHLTADTVREWGRRFSNWGRWGPDDQRGTLNFITRERVLAACALPRSGRVISCGLPFHAEGPQSGPPGRANPVHRMLTTGGQTLDGGVEFADDAVDMPLQCATQWDSLAHVFYDGRMYNDRPSSGITEQGAEANSIDRVADSFVARGVLLDLPRVLGVAGLDPGTPVTPDMLDTSAERCGVTVEPGDVLLVRTGHMARTRAAGSLHGYANGPAPGLSVHCARWLYEREVAAVATDTAALEVIPSEVPECLIPFHMIAIRDMGMSLGEMFDLDPLASACAEDHGYAFLFSAPPLPFLRAVGSPVNPIAIK